MSSQFLWILPALACGPAAGVIADAEGPCGPCLAVGEGTGKSHTSGACLHPWRGWMAGWSNHCSLTEGRGWGARLTHRQSGCSSSSCSTSPPAASLPRPCASGSPSPSTGCPWMPSTGPGAQPRPRDCRTVGRAGRPCRLQPETGGGRGRALTG